MSMSEFSGNRPIWWDRDVDSTGQPLRQDVRAAAHAIWDRAYSRVQAILGDSCDAAGLMEGSVAQVSRYLNRTRAVPDENAASAILMCAFCRALRRYAIKLHRIELIGDFTELAETASFRTGGPTKEDCRLDAERAARRLSPRARTMLELRKVGFEWKEIAAVLKMTNCAARAEFSREVKKARLRHLPTKTGNRESGSYQNSANAGSE
jgi:DNA-directed RNA polymerase specialized sigma24 family protein